MYSFDFPNGRWGGAKRLPFVVERTATTLADGTQGYFIINNQGQTLTVDPQTLATRPVSGQWDFNVVNYVNIDGNVLELKGSQIYSQNKSWDMTSDLDVEQMVAVPLYDAFQVQ